MYRIGRAFLARRKVAIHGMQEKLYQRNKLRKTCLQYQTQQLNWRPLYSRRQPKRNMPEEWNRRYVCDVLPPHPVYNSMHRARL